MICLVVDHVKAIAFLMLVWEHVNEIQIFNIYETVFMNDIRYILSFITLTFKVWDMIGKT